MTHKQAFRILFIWLAVLMAIIALLFASGCMTPQKAVSYLKEKKLLDDTCAANYPCVTTDSITVISRSDSAEYLDVIASLQDDLYKAWSLADSLYTVVNQPVNILDTNCRKYAAAINRLKAENETLKRRIANIPAVHDTVTVRVKVRDTALEQTYIDQRDDCNKALEKMAGKRDGWRKASMVTWGLLLLLILVGYLIKKFTNKKIRVV